MIMITKNCSNHLQLSRNYTNVLKFLTCLLIATHHYCGTYYFYTDDKTIVLRAMVTMGGVIGVNLFFFLSGYGLMMSEKKVHLGFIEFIRKRLFKVYLPAVLAGVIGTVYFQFVYHQEQDLTIAVVNILLLNSDNVFWFMQALIALYLVFGISAQLLVKNRKVGVLCLIVLTLLVCLLDWYLDVDYHATNIPAFAMGCLIALFDDKIYEVLHNNKILFVLLMTITLAAFMLRVSTFWFNAVAAYTVAFAIVLASAFVKIDTGDSSFLGDYSFDIYLIHNKVNYLTIMTEGQLLYPWYIALVLVASYVFNRIRKFLHI